jgi:N-acyl-D-amino-acid deacylase
LKDRGVVREGNMADLVIMDLERIRDAATFFEPHQYPEGIENVLVSVKFVVYGGEPTGSLPGKIITTWRER